MKDQTVFRHWIAALWLSLTVAMPAVALAADGGTTAATATPGTKRPKICLVLSGGGARGAAHVGVIKVLEEYRVPIDCIAGTSMGALVGATYATGSTVAEMNMIVGGISTDLFLKEQPPRQERSMRRKYDDYGLFVGPEIGVGKGELWLAKGLVTGVQLETVLRQLARVKGFRRFDELPIPYRAVATDLVTGKAVVFKEGEMASVMRASMAVPGAIAPAEFDNMMLVDGMLTDNLPVQVARDMGADVVIAVNVGTPLLKREQLNGILGVTGQMLSILTEQNVQASLALLQPSDILITPELGDFYTGDFDHLPSIVPLGEAAARKAAGRLAQLSMPAAEYAALRQRQQIVVKSDTHPVDEIRISGLHRVNPVAVEAVMDTQAGEPIDQEKLDRDMRRIYGMGNFEHVKYHFLEEPSRRVLVVDAVEKSWGQDFLRFGLGLSYDFRGEAYFNIVGSYRRYWLNSLGAEWRTDLQLGRTSSLLSEFYQPLTSTGRLFVAPSIAVGRRVSDVFQGDRKVAQYSVATSEVGFWVGSQLGRYGEARVGLVRGVDRPRLDIGPPSLSPGSSSIDQGAVRAAVVFDQIDSTHFPRSGWRGGLSVFNARSELGASNEYTKWDLTGGTAHSFGGNTVSVSGKFGGRIGSDPLPRYDLFQWGGFLQQSGYATGQLLGDSVRYGRLMYYRRVLDGTLFQGAFAGMSLEFGKVGNPLVEGSPEGLLKSASLFVAVDSPVGPIYVGYGHASDGNSAFYFYLGDPF